MLIKVIYGINHALKTFLITILFPLGVYATYQIIFRMQIPVLVSLTTVIFIFYISYLMTMKPQKMAAIPVMVVKEGRPIKASIEVKA